MMVSKEMVIQKCDVVHVELYSIRRPVKKLPTSVRWLFFVELKRCILPRSNNDFTAECNIDRHLWVPMNNYNFLFGDWPAKNGEPDTESVVNTDLHKKIRICWRILESLRLRQHWTTQSILFISKQNNFWDILKSWNFHAHSFPDFPRARNLDKIPTQRDWMRWPLLWNRTHICQN